MHPEPPKKENNKSSPGWSKSSLVPAIFIGKRSLRSQGGSRDKKIDFRGSVQGLLRFGVVSGHAGPAGTGASTGEPRGGQRDIDPAK